MKYKRLYKFMRTGLKSNSGNHVWSLNEWYKEEKVDICNSGFHASQTPLQALGYVPGEIIAEVEVRGKSQIEDNKECWSEMRIVKAYKWEKKDSVALSIFAAELCLENFEKLYPNDKRPREAIEAARKVLGADTEENRSAAESAKSAAESAAESARSASESAKLAAWSAARSAKLAAWSAARSAAWSAASAARSAAESARSAAESAAWSARSAAWSAAWSAAKKSLIGKIDEWFLAHIKTLTPLQ